MLSMIQIVHRKLEAHAAKVHTHMCNDLITQDSISMKWHTYSREARKKLKAPEASRPWTGRASKSLTGVPRTPRIMDCLDIAFLSLCEESGISPDLSDEDLAPYLETWYVNPSQSCHLKPWSSKTPRCALGSSKWYGFAADSVIDCRVAEAMLGWTPEPSDDRLAISAAHRFELASEAMHLGCLASVMVALLVGLNPPGLFYDHGT